MADDGWLLENATPRGGRVGIVGGGVAGLQAARALRKRFDVTVFEGADTVGGVWRENYLNFGLQTPKELYEFPDFEMSHVEWGQYPSGQEVQAYIEEYTDHFKLRPLVQTSTRVLHIALESNGWIFTIEKVGEPRVKERFDFCVIATGIYSKTKMYIPLLPGRQLFQGKVLHSSDFVKKEQVENRTVVVVGGGKSAVDCAVEAMKVPGTKVTLVTRAPHWPTPRRFLGLISFEYLFYTRTAAMVLVGLTGPLPGGSARRCETLWHWLSWCLIALVFKLVELLVSLQFRIMCGASSPLGKVGLVSDFYGHAQILDGAFHQAVQEEKVGWLCGEAPAAFTSTGLKLQGQEVKADVVIFATGFHKDHDIFSNAVQSELGSDFDGLYLWRHTIPARVPKLAFVGSEVAGISNIGLYGVQAAWLAKYWTQRVEALSVEEMEQEIEATKAWKRSWMPDSQARANWVLFHQLCLMDQFLVDMGLSIYRKSNALAELFSPYRPRDYNGLFEDGHRELS